MSRSRVHQLVSIITVGLLLAGCVPEDSPPERQSLDELVAQVEAANEGADPDGHDHGDHDHDQESEGDEGAAAQQGSNVGGESIGDPVSEPTSGPAPGSTGQPSPESATHASDEPEGPFMEQHDDFPITVTLSATCVEQGGAMTILIEASRDTGVAYLAYYAGGESGAPAPWGQDHGGNNGDMTDKDGRYEDTWVVSPTAPVGPARVEVMARRNYGEAEMATGVERFEVVEAGTGRCDQ